MTNKLTLLEFAVLWFYLFITSKINEPPDDLHHMAELRPVIFTKSWTGAAVRLTDIDILFSWCQAAYTVHATICDVCGDPMRFFVLKRVVFTTTLISWFGPWSRSKPPRGGQWPRGPWTLGGPLASGRPLASGGSSSRGGPSKWHWEARLWSPDDLFFWRSPNFDQKNR